MRNKNNCRSARRKPTQQGSEFSLKESIHAFGRFVKKNDFGFGQEQLCNCSTLQFTPAYVIRIAVKDALKLHNVDNLFDSGARKLICFGSRFQLFGNGIHNKAAERVLNKNSDFSC